MAIDEEDTVGREQAQSLADHSVRCYKLSKAYKQVRPRPRLSTTGLPQPRLPLPLAACLPMPHLPYPHPSGPCSGCKALQPEQEGQSRKTNCRWLVQDTALKEFSLTMARGSCVALLGHNGYVERLVCPCNCG